jgi:outer membrane protein YopM
MQQAQKIIDQWLHANNEYEWIDLDNLGLETLPPIPNNCRRLYCSNNKLTKLPDLYNCRILYCYNNQLVTLPELPNCEFLKCNNNQLVILPELPVCTDLQCQYNNLIQLPDLPKCASLNCSHNDLKTLPNLPACTSLICNNNKLTVLPELLKCARLCLSFNQLTSLPRIKKHCLIMHIETSIIQCSCFEFANNNNKYIYMSDKQLRNLMLPVQSTKINTKISYNNCAKVIQRAFRKHIKRKYFGDLLMHLVKGPSGIVWGYVFK